MFSINSTGDYANKIGTGEWHSVSASKEYMDWVAVGNTAGPYVEPPAPVPDVVDMAQARLALLEGDKLTLVNQAIAAMTGAQGDRARIEWEFRQRVRRDSELVQSLVAGFGWTQQEVDDLFTLAATK
jgi:hypothetical protein